MTAFTETTRWTDPADLLDRVSRAVTRGARFVGLAAHASDGDSTALRVVLGDRGALTLDVCHLPAGRESYPSLTPTVPAAFWYERAIHDLFGLIPEGHPRLDPLVFPLGRTTPATSRPGRQRSPEPLNPHTFSLPGHVEGEGVFTIPYGPVRSGVFETVEYLVETFGEDIPRVRVRPYLKHRGLANRSRCMSIDDGVLLAERVEGTMSVAHAWAFSQAVEDLAGVQPPEGASLLRLIHAELERIANHLDSMVRHTEGAGQAVAYARLSWLKERIMRLRAELCGHRFGRGLVLPGGTSGPPLLHPEEALASLTSIRSALARDVRMLMTTPSFLDRLRTTGVIPPELAQSHCALGPVGRASGAGPDVRIERPYGPYAHLRPGTPPPRLDGDALARQWVRVEEVADAFDLAAAALEQLAKVELGEEPWAVPVPPVSGTGVGSVESPQGELVYLVDVEDGHLLDVCARTASFHNFALFSSAFRGDIFTDFVFIEASFGVNLAGVAG